MYLVYHLEYFKMKRGNRLCLLGVLLVALTGVVLMGCRMIGNAQPRERQFSQKFTEQAIEAGSKTRYFIAVRPESYTPNKPAVVLLHGGGQSMRKVLARNNATHRWLELAEQEGFLLLVPNGFNFASNDAYGDRQSWNDLRANRDQRRSREDDVSFILQMLDWASANHGIDRSHVYVTGASNGGMMTFRLLVEQPQHFAAGVSFIASLPRDNIPDPIQGTPIMMMNGTADTFVPWQGGAMSNGAEPVRSIDETLNYWIRANGADPKSANRRVIPSSNPTDGCQITETSYSIAPNTPSLVRFYRVEGGGHNIPALNPPRYPPQIQRLLGKQCQGVNGIDLAWEFIKMF